MLCRHPTRCLEPITRGGSTSSIEANQTLELIAGEALRVITRQSGTELFSSTPSVDNRVERRAALCGKACIGGLLLQTAYFLGIRLYDEHPQAVVVLGGFRGNLYRRTSKGLDGDLEM